MLMNIWTLGRHPNMSRFGKSMAGLLYVLSILEESEQILTAIDKKPIGFCGYGIGKNKKIYTWLIKAILAILPNKDQKLYQRYYQMSAYGELHSSPQNAEITILIVNPEYYGKGLGKQLIESIEKEAAKKGAQTIFALSDSGCHWHFYEKQGYIKIFEQEEIFDNSPKDKETQYIFQKKLPKRQS